MIFLKIKQKTKPNENKLPSHTFNWENFYCLNLNKGF